MGNFLNKVTGRQSTGQGVGGRGESRKVLLPIGDNIGREIEITPMTVDEFCAKYELGDDILHRLNNDKVESDIGALITAKDLTSPEYGLKLGHVAEVKWALKLFLLSCPGIKEMELPVKGTTGGEGGHGEKQGGEGGLGKGPVFTPQDMHRFAIQGGQGGDGGEAGAPPPAVIAPQDLHRLSVIQGGQGGDGGEAGVPPPTVIAPQDMQRFRVIQGGQGGDGGEAGAPPPAVTKKDRAIGGGQGGVGGVGSRAGGDGGTGYAPVIPLEAVGTFQWMQGQKGTGGPGVRIGGKGGTGEPPKFPKPLVEIEQTQRHRVNANNVRLKEGEGINPKLREFNPQLNEKLIDRLHELGFQTVGGLFEIYDVDLDKEPFETGNKESLKITLEQFLIRSE